MSVEFQIKQENMNSTERPTLDPVKEVKEQIYERNYTRKTMEQS